MRWLVMLLLAVNGLVWLAGDFWAPERIRVVAASQTLPRVSTLKIGETVPDVNANDVAGGSVVESGSDEGATTPVPSVSVPEPPTCVRLGWFETADGAREAYRALGGPGSQFSIREQERALEPLHWVIVPPQPEAEALRLFNDLQRRGIDSYLVTRGENTNAISLGLFQSEDAAQRVLEAKKSQNLNAVLAKFTRNQISYALVFEVSRPGNAGAGDGWLRDYRADFEMVEISRCEGVATTPENP
jgi:hypothetical protein